MSPDPVVADTVATVTHAGNTPWTIFLLLAAVVIASTLLYWRFKKAPRE